MEHISKLWGDNLPLPGNKFDCYEQIGEKVYHTRRDKWRTWIIYKHHNSNNLREGFRWNITQDNSNEEVDGFKISRSWQHVNHETWIQIIENDIIPPPMIRKKELHSGLPYEESLSFLEKNVDEHFENELSPWWNII